jgi:hypothetical protein
MPTRCPHHHSSLIKGLSGRLGRRNRFLQCDRIHQGALLANINSKAFAYRSVAL